MDYWKGLYGSYDAANDVLIMFHNELTLTYENWVDPIFAGPTNPQGSEKKTEREIRTRSSKKR